MPSNEQITLKNFTPAVGEDKIVEAMIKGLRSNQKYIQSKFFYDKVGSELFEEITKLKEYYQPNIESLLIREIAEKIKHDVEDGDIVELGSGDCSKISLFLDALPRHIIKTVRYIPVDVSPTVIKKSAKQLAQKFPELRIRGIAADFLEHLDRIPKERKRIFCFFGSTIGNLSEKQASIFMDNLSRIMQLGDYLILGMDMVKDICVLERAYNDEIGVTVKFNKNILNVVNRHLRTNFIPDNFEHIAFFNKDESRIEMHLKAKNDMLIKSPILGEYISLIEGETIHTENSHKYTDDAIGKLAKDAGLKINKIVTDEKNWFSLVEMVK